MNELLLYLARSLADEPERLDLVEMQTQNTVVLELRVGRDDLGRVIGRQGRTARALRTVLSAAGEKKRTRVVLKIAEAAE